MSYKDIDVMSRGIDWIIAYRKEHGCTLREANEALKEAKLNRMNGVPPIQISNDLILAYQGYKARVFRNLLTVRSLKILQKSALKSISHGMEFKASHRGSSKSQQEESNMPIRENIIDGMKRYRVDLCYVALDEQGGSLVQVDTFAHTNAQAVENALYYERDVRKQTMPLQTIEVYELSLVSRIREI